MSAFFTYDVYVSCFMSHSRSHREPGCPFFRSHAELHPLLPHVPRGPVAIQQAVSSDQRKSMAIVQFPQISTQIDYAKFAPSQADNER